MASFNFETSPRIVCEQGSAGRIGALAQGLNATHVFIVTDAFLHSSGLTSGLLKGLNEAGLKYTLYTDVLADPPEASVQAAVAHAAGSGADAVIGFGGGSAMDTAKLVALLVRTPQDIPSIYGVDVARGPRLPLIQVPTTAGTGSEVTPISILTTPTDEKKGVVSSCLYPDIAVLDSTLTLGLPAAITAATGIDAMVHAIEAYTSRHKKNPLSDALALQALKALHDNIRTVLAEPTNADAREAMLMGSLFAGMAFANAPVAAVHALAYPLGGRYHLPHGLTNALVLSPVLRFNRPAAARHYAELERALDPSASRDDEPASIAFIERMCALVAEMPFSHTLSGNGVREADLPLLAQDAMAVQRLLINNPREVTLADALAIYESVYA
ncbi:alcohol dehydrogenase class IV [Paraperlucidibaca baekdonensis]|uniref:Alcohol dehydrogenase class IV n=1 Tax=Paraperlucidibaca baekdonensis TaxID=748120 RepID=A0A3E0H5G8_9GAMM|nr:iron-containing alcohol dehydrogenase [Paraperlucidibaca baekdonensis]REH37682.1 alcohol dehydrogenase class IV [Paraperlucidibaca baekdonensis]